MQHAHRFPRKARVLRPGDFARAFASGRRASGRYFRCVFLIRTPDSAAPAQTARLGMAISRKVDGRAVERNRIRRLIREWFRHRPSGGPAGDLVVSGKAEASGVDAARLFADLDAIARRLGLIAPAPAPTMADSSRASLPGDDS